MVGITVNVDTSKRAYEIADAYKRKGVPVVLGGIHASAKPEEALEHADAVCIGEAEGVWQRVIADAPKRTAFREIPERLARRSRSVSPISSGSWWTNRSISTPMSFMPLKGCPFRCRFCYNSCDYMRFLIATKPSRK